VPSPGDAQLLERLSHPPAGKDVIDRAELKRRLGLESDFLAARILAQFDMDQDGAVSRIEFIYRVQALVQGDPVAKLLFAFRLHDEDGNGLIDRQELLRMLRISLAENRLAFGDGVVDRLADGVFERADANRDGNIDFDEFVAALRHYPELFEHMSLGDLRWLGFGAAPESEPVVRWPIRMLRSLRAHAFWWVLAFIYAIACIALFTEAGLRYHARGADALLIIARGAGACLNMHGALMLLPMMRGALTRLGRRTWGRLLLDEHVLAHRTLGNVAFYFGALHGAAHLTRFATGTGGVSWSSIVTLAGITGVILIAVHAIMWLCARAFIRKSRRHELFAFTHWLWPVWTGLMLAHGPVAWIWMTGPVVIFLVDKLLARKTWSTKIESASVLASGVTRLTIARPKQFRYRASDYVFVRVPALSRAEWHPFTISSAPERADVFTLHVRATGNWTRALRELASKSPKMLPAFIDGPYGTPSAHIEGSERVLLVAAGIGVTPFASVLSSLIEQRRRGGWPRPTRVHFVWVCNDPSAFGWFADLLGEVESSFLQAFDVRVFLNAGSRDVRSAILRVAIDALYAQTRTDAVTGLRARTSLGAPDWDSLVASMAAAHDTPLRAFYCGPPGLAPSVQRACNRHGVVFRMEQF
jgi:ferredoxin-NADP reductase/Ca2+-binding EF-hand superfamily protein